MRAWGVERRLRRGRRAPRSRGRRGRSSSRTTSSSDRPARASPATSWSRGRGVLARSVLAHGLLAGHVERRSASSPRAITAPIAGREASSSTRIEQLDALRLLVTGDVHTLRAAARPLRAREPARLRRPCSARARSRSSSSSCARRAAGRATCRTTTVLVELAARPRRGRDPSREDRSPGRPRRAPRDRARAPRELVMRVYAERTFAVELKGPNDPVTRADREANALICERARGALSRRRRSSPRRATRRRGRLRAPRPERARLLRRSGRRHARVRRSRTASSP